MATHVLITGPITGRIPVPSPDHPDDFVDVTPDVLYFDHDDENEVPPALLAVASAIDDEHHVRGTHPSLETGGN